jgi:hypothetical protein
MAPGLSRLLRPTEAPLELRRGTTRLRPETQVTLLRPRKRETKTHRTSQRLAGKAINLWDTTHRAPQLLFLESHVSYKRATPGAGRRS